MRETGTIGWKCRECGNINSLQAKFCNKCGTPASFGIPVDTTTEIGVPRDIEPKRNNASKKGLLIAGIVLLALTLIGGGIFLAVKLIQTPPSIEEAVPDTSQEELIDEPETQDSADIDHDTLEDLPSLEGQTDNSKDSYYIVGQDYYVQPSEGLRVRSEPSAANDATILKRNQLTSEDMANAHNGDLAVLKKGSKVTCLEMKDNWMRISSGWICVEDNGEVFVK